MSSRTGIKLLAITLLLLVFAMFNDDGVRRNVLLGWKLIRSQESGKLQAAAEQASEMLEQTSLRSGMDLSRNFTIPLRS